MFDTEYGMGAGAIVVLLKHPPQFQSRHYCLEIR